MTARAESATEARGRGLLAALFGGRVNAVLLADFVSADPAGAPPGASRDLILREATRSSTEPLAPVAWQHPPQQHVSSEPPEPSERREA